MYGVNQYMKCSYGCGQEGPYQLKSGKWCCSFNYQSCPTLREKNKKGLEKAYRDGVKIPATQSYQNLPQETKDNMAWSRGKTAFSDSRVNSKYDPLKVFILSDIPANNERLRNIIIAEKLFEYKCQLCGLDPIWEGRTLTLDLDHTNGNRKDNRLENLRFLCPNCHSQTPTFRGRNTKRKQTSYKTDEEITKAFHSSNNIRQILLFLDLAPKGGNYQTIQNRLKQLGLEFKD